MYGCGHCPNKATKGVRAGSFGLRMRLRRPFSNGAERAIRCTGDPISRPTPSCLALPGTPRLCGLCHRRRPSSGPGAALQRRMIARIEQRQPFRDCREAAVVRTAVEQRGPTAMQRLEPRVPVRIGADIADQHLRAAVCSTRSLAVNPQPQGIGKQNCRPETGCAKLST